MTLNLDQQIKIATENEGRFRKHYRMPRMSGATSYLIQLANDLYQTDQKVVVVAEHSDGIRQLRVSGLDAGVKTLTYASGHDIGKFRGLSLDWVIIDGLYRLHRVEESIFHEALDIITKNYLRIDTI